MDRQPEENQGRIRYIDGLRALAVAAVIVDHIAWHYKGRTPAAFGPIARIPAHAQFWHILLEGTHGVDLFFVLSGFCLAYPFLKRVHEGDAMGFDGRQFFTNRVFRIMPPFLIALAVFSVPAVRARFVTLADVFREAVFLNHYPSINESFWTLAVEFRWYLVFPLLLGLWVRSKKWFYTVLAAAVGLYLSRLVPLIDLGALPGFMLGIIAAHLEIKKHPARLWIGLAVLPLLVCAIACEQLFVAQMHYAPVGEFLQTQITWQLAAFAFVVLSGVSNPVKAVLSMRVPVAIGVASYSLYLTHAPLITSFAQTWGRGSAIVFATVSVTLCAAIGFAFYAYVERPLTMKQTRKAILAFLDAGVSVVRLRWRPTKA